MTPLDSRGDTRRAALPFEFACWARGYTAVAMDRHQGVRLGNFADASNSLHDEKTAWTQAELLRTPLVDVGFWSANSDRRLSARGRCESSNPTRFLNFKGRLPVDSGPIVEKAFVGTPRSYPRMQSVKAIYDPECRIRRPQSVRLPGRPPRCGSTANNIEWQSTEKWAESMSSKPLILLLNERAQQDPNPPDIGFGPFKVPSARKEAKCLRLLSPLI